MNIFMLDEEPEQAAKWHCDKHINKMVIEYAQILSTAAYKNGFHEPERMYQPVPGINPNVHDWCAESRSNFIWLLKLARATADEYQYRYGRVHKSYKDVISEFDITEIRAPNKDMTEVPLSMPDVYKTDGDPVKSYREFYIYGKDWRMSWFNRDEPGWYPEHAGSIEYRSE